MQASNKKGRPSKPICEKCGKKFTSMKYFNQHNCEKEKEINKYTKCIYCGEEIQKTHAARHKNSCSKKTFLKATMPLIILFCKLINIYNKILKRKNYFDSEKNIKKVIYDFLLNENKDKLTEGKIKEELDNIFKLHENLIKKDEIKEKKNELEKKIKEKNIEKLHDRLIKKINNVDEGTDEESESEIINMLNNIQEEEDEIKSEISDNEYIKENEKDKIKNQEINKINLKKNENIINIKIKEKDEILKKEIIDYYGFLPEEKYIKLFIDAKNWFIPGISAREIIKKYYSEQIDNLNEIMDTIEKKFNKKDYPTSDEIFNLSPDLFQRIQNLRENSNYSDDFEKFYYIFKNLNEKQKEYQCPLCDKIIIQKKKHMLNCKNLKEIFNESKKEAISYFINLFYPLIDKEPYILFYEKKDYEYFKKNICMDIYNKTKYMKKRINDEPNELLNKKTKRELTKKEFLKEIYEEANL